MRVLVVHPPVTVGADFIDQPWQADLGAVQLAAVLRRRHDVALVDAFSLPEAGVGRGPGGALRLGASPAAVLAAAGRSGPFDAAVVALSPFHRPPGRDAELGPVCAGLRATLGGAPLLLADCFQSGQHYLEADGAAVLAAYPEADAWVKYEAEATLPRLLDAFATRGERPRGVQAGREADLADLPPPAWDLVDLSARDRFHAAVIAGIGRGDWPFPIDGRTLPVITSRGCPWSCIHCTSNPGRPPGAPKLQRRLPRPALAALMDELVRRHGATRLMVLDEMLNADAGHLSALLEEAERLGVPLEIPNGMRADRLDATTVDRLRGRITTLSVSAESGSQRVVDEVVGKRLDLSSIERVAVAAQAAGLPLLVHYMIGLPGESPAEVNATLQHALDLHDRLGALPALQFATPLPGSALAAPGAAPRSADYGPAFQAIPSATDPLVPPAQLARFRWAFERRLRGSRQEKLIVNLTYRCNNHCAFCAVGNRVARDGDPARQRALLEEHRARGVRLVDFDGGEPTLSDALFDLVSHARALGYERIAVTTNGRRCSYGRFAERLARSGVTTLLVSLHGADRSTHGRLVGVEEAFDQTVAGIRNLVRAAPPGLELGVNTTVTRANQGGLEAVADLAWQLGIRWLNLQFLTPFGRATREHAPDMPAAAAAVARIAGASRPRGMRLEVVNLPFCLLPDHAELLAPDLGKRARSMVFVNDEEVNLGAYLAARRVRRPECAPCAFAACCAGFYELDDVPEPPWLGVPGATTGTNSAAPNRSR